MTFLSSFQKGKPINKGVSIPIHLEEKIYKILQFHVIESKNTCIYTYLILQIVQ